MGRMEVGTAGKGKGRGNKGGRGRMDTLISETSLRPGLRGSKGRRGKDWGRCREGKDMQHGPYSENFCIALPWRNTGIGPT